MAFHIPSAEERQAAIGDTGGLSKPMQRAFTPKSDFDPIPPPQPGDWLAAHPEPGQSFAEFVASHPNRPTERRNTLYLQPLGEFPEDRSPSPDLLEAYGAAFFDMPVKRLPILSINRMGLTTRVNPMTGNRQILTRDVLALLKRRLPDDAFCILAFTMEDLYPDPSWNFVFGQASLRERVGVFSFARYDPAFYGENRGEDYRETLLRRSCKVLAHETAHMFHLAHCVYFHCLMNGSNHLKESDARPLRLCPVCLRKLYDSIGFDMVERYRRLQGFYEKVGFSPEAAWIRNRAAFIQKGDGS
ncbi:MAG: archaemetzincin [Thermodesulfobacteriota bacterium]